MKASAKTLLHHIVDYAGLFPPAELDMRRTATNYDAYRRGENAWALGRLILPVSRLGELEESMSGIGAGGEAQDRWRLSVLVGDDVAAGVARIAEFNARRDSAAAHSMVIDAVELKAAEPAAVERVGEHMPPSIAVFWEIPIGENPQEFIVAIAAAGANAKVRTGGVTETAFPTPQDIVRFMVCCLREQVAFKATAGLHHPLRSIYPLTYEPDAATGTMHGFLNVFLSAAFLRAGLGGDEVLLLLEEQSADAFEFDDTVISWRSHQLNEDQIAAARHSFALSFGSCSFEDPIADMKGINFL